jgi:hypothetical protein
MSLSALLLGPWCLLLVVRLHPSLPFMGEVSTDVWLHLWLEKFYRQHLCFIDALLVGGDSRSIAGFHRFHHSSSRIPPLEWRWMMVRGARTRWRCHH